MGTWWAGFPDNVHTGRFLAIFRVHHPKNSRVSRYICGGTDWPYHPLLGYTCRLDLVTDLRDSIFLQWIGEAILRNSNATVSADKSYCQVLKSTASYNG